MPDNTPKRFTILRADSDMDAAKVREESIGNVLDENIKRDYKFSVNPLKVSEQPIIMVMPDSDIDNYWRVLLESVSTLNQDISLIISQDAPKDSMQSDLQDKLCKMSSLMDYIVHTESWKNNELNTEDKNVINEMIEKLKI